MSTAGFWKFLLEKDDCPFLASWAVIPLAVIGAGLARLPLPVARGLALRLGRLGPRRMGPLAPPFLLIALVEQMGVVGKEHGKGEEKD